MTVKAEVLDPVGQLAELMQQVKAGNEVVLTQDNKPIAKLVPAGAAEIAPLKALKIHSLKGHRVLTPSISQTELAEEMFERQ